MNVQFVFIGQNGVIVETSALRITLRVADKSTFNLTSKSHEFLLAAILCEKGDLIILHEINL